MAFTIKYMDEALYYQPWKTKFIERFCIPYAKLQRYIKDNGNDIKKDILAESYSQLFIVVMNVLKRFLKAEYSIQCLFYTDIIFNSYKKGLIDNKEIYFKVLRFLEKYKQNKDNYEEFSLDYINIYDHFSTKFKELVRTSGNRSKDYFFYDNSEFLWGLKREYYEIIVKFFLQYPSIKIVRIFGSRVAAEYHEFSDLDLIFEGTYSKSEYYDIIDKFIDLELPYIIDVYDIRSENQAFLYRNTVRSNIFFARKNYVADDYVIAFN